MIKKPKILDYCQDLGLLNQTFIIRNNAKL